MRPYHVLALTVLLCASIVRSSAVETPPGPSRAEPAEPKWGDTISVRYDTAASGAGFLADDEVFVVVTEQRYNSDRRFSIAMTRKGPTLEAELPVAQGVCYLSLAFVTRGAYDGSADLELSVRDADGKPPKGAYLAKGDHSRQPSCAGLRCSFDDDYDKELALYPDSFAVYPSKWMIVSMINREHYDEIVRADIAKLPVESAGEAADLVRARLSGALAVGQGDKAKALWLDLVHRFPQADETADTFTDVLKATMMRLPGLPDFNDVRASALEAIRAAPDSPLARRVANMHLLEGEPISLVDSVCKAWQRREPEAYAPYLVLARALDEAKSDPERGLEAARKVLVLVMSGAARRSYDVQGRATDYVLAEAYLLEAKFHLARHELAEANAAAQTAGLGSRADDPEALIVQGNIWMAAGDWARAEKIFGKTLSLDDGKAGRDALKALYVARHGGEAGFEEYAKGVAAAAKPSGAAASIGLPQKKVKTIDGRTVDLAALHGKVVVLNFFSLGCAPCIAEVPALNRVVDGYKTNAKVVFLAAAGDDAGNLKAFLKKHPFSYRMVPEDSAIIPQFKIDCWPTHVVIGRDGSIASRFCGGSDGVADMLKTKIDAALQ
jgi:thiol-disulfide isomerase/thioredoxin